MSYVTEARDRAKRRKSRWNLLLLPAVFLPLCTVWAATVLLVEGVHTFVFPGQTLRTGTGIWPVIAVIAPLAFVIPLSMLVGNLLVSSIAPARRALDQEAAAHPAYALAASQVLLRKGALYGAVISVGACLLGAVRPW